jgi:hypothetical protein
MRFHPSACRRATRRRPTGARVGPQIDFAATDVCVAPGRLRAMVARSLTHSLVLLQTLLYAPASPHLLHSVSCRSRPNGRR